MLPWDSASLKERKIIKEGIVRKVVAVACTGCPIINGADPRTCTIALHVCAAGRLIVKGGGVTMYVRPLRAHMTCAVA